MAKSKKKKQGNTRKPSLNIAFLLALFSLLFCWFYGLPALVAGIFALRGMAPKRKTNKSSKGVVAFKQKWGYALAWAGIAFSAIFTIYYSMAFISGGFIRL